jgi:hypothetical protein
VISKERVSVRCEQTHLDDDRAPSGEDRAHDGRREEGCERVSARNLRCRSRCCCSPILRAEACQQEESSPSDACETHPWTWSRRSQGEEENRLAVEDGDADTLTHSNVVEKEC